MAKIVSKNQSIVTGVTVPRSAYSRVVGVWCQVKGVATIGWGYTPSLGQNLRLLGVKIYFSPEQDQAGQQINYGVFVGHSKPSNAADILGWDPVIPIYMPDGRATIFTQTQESETMTFEMNQLFKGEEIRFGTWINGSGVVAICEMYTFFHIMEG